MRSNLNRKAGEVDVPIKVVLFVLFLALLWGGISVSIKVGLQEFAPFALAGLRYSIGLFVIVLWATSQGESLKPKSGELLRLILFGLLFTGQTTCLNLGTNLTHAGRSVVFVNTHPFFVAIVSHFIVPGDRLGRWKNAGLIIAFSGILIVFWDNLIGGEEGRLAGDFLTLLSGFQLGLLITLTNRLVQSIHPYRLLTSQMMVGVPFFFIFSAIFEGKVGYGFSNPALFAVLYQGVVVAGFCLVAWTLVLKRYPPSRVAVLFFTTPLWGIALSNLLLKEPLTPGLGIGTILVVLGIYLVNRFPNSVSKSKIEKPRQA